jgi:predicted acylesterase/phospholipase RssA
MAEMGRIGVALSGGGHRASLFGLGALLYLADAGKNREVTSIASVSGGSLTNGFVGQAGDYPAMTGEQFRDAVKPLARRIARQGTLWAAPLTWAYLAGLALVALAVLVGTWFLPWPAWARVLVLLAGLVVLALVAGLRGAVCGRAFATTLFSPPRGSSRRPTRLDELATRVDHVICATDLHAGEHVYFSGRFVCAYRFGWGVPGDLPLHVAVQASAALPGGFPPRWLRTARHRFVDGRPEAGGAPMILADGGVYDNMGDQWPQEVADRNRRWARHDPGLNEPDELVVANASAPMGWSSQSRLRLPGIGELLALKRDQSILYDNGTSVRRQAMIARFRYADVIGGGLRGSVVQIDRSPYLVPEAFARSTTWPERAERARTVLGLLTDDKPAWDAVVAANRSVKTTLSRLGPEASASLLRHGYALAMANLHVLLDYPALKIPPASSFEELVS